MVIAVVPALNESSTIGSVVRSLFDHVDRVVVVDDGSTDNTAHHAQQAGASVVCHSLNRGQGAALETGHEYARRIGATHVIHFDADGQFSADDIPGALAALKKSGADMLLGSRFLGKAPVNMPLSKQYILHPVARFVSKRFWGITHSDVHNGFRILTRRALDTVSIYQDRAAHATEIPLSASRAGLRLLEYPVSVTYTRYGQGPRTALIIAKDLLLSPFIR
jgi:polyprenyl-phospho-N-acetylgalactosaminyl synthase